MTKSIDRMHASSGRVFEEDDTLTNVLDLLRGTTGRGPGSYLSSRITDRQGRSIKISQKGELFVGMMFDDIDITFQYGIRPAKIKTDMTGTGSVGTDKSTATISPGTGVGSAQIVSVEPVRYRGGHESYLESSYIFRVPELNLNQYGGFLTTEDRFCVGYQGLVFGILFTEGGNETFVPMVNANIDPLDGTGPSGLTINPQTINVYRLSYVWHGGLPLTVEIQHNQQWWPVHVFDFSNQITETHLENPHLPAGMMVERLTGTGTDDGFKSGSWRAGSIGGSDGETGDYWVSHTVLDASIINDRNNVFTIVNPATWQGKNNYIVYELGVLTISSALNKTAEVFGVTDATITGGGSLTDIDVDNTPLQFIDGGTITGGSRGLATVIKSGGDSTLNVINTGLRLYPGSQYTIEVNPGGAVNGTMSISSRWRGEH